jgi:hypothetical protein
MLTEEKEVAKSRKEVSRQPLAKRVRREAEQRHVT